MTVAQTSTAYFVGVGGGRGGWGGGGGGEGGLHNASEHH